MILVSGAVNGALQSGGPLGLSDKPSGELVAADADLVDMGPYKDLTQIPFVWLTFVIGLVWILSLTDKLF